MSLAMGRVETMSCGNSTVVMAIRSHSLGLALKDKGNLDSVNVKLLFARKLPAANDIMLLVSPIKPKHQVCL